MLLAPNQSRPRLPIDCSSQRRALAHLGIAAVAAVGLASCAGATGQPMTDCSRAPLEMSRTGTAAPGEPLLGMFALPNTAVILARLDPLTLKPVSQHVLVGEYHNTWSLSPNRSHLAVGVSAPGIRRRIGIRIVDLDSMKVVRDVETGIAAAAVAWLAPRRLVAALLREGTVVVDTQTGKILHRWSGLADPHMSARMRDRFVVLFPSHTVAPPEGVATARLAVIDSRARLRSVILRRIQIGGARSTHAAALAVDPERARAYVFAADAPVAEVDLRTMRVSYRRLELMSLRPGGRKGAEVQQGDALRGRRREAIWLGTGKALVVGRDLVATRAGALASLAAGAALVDTRKWSWCMLDARGSRAAFGDRTLLVYGSPAARNAPGDGLRAYTVEGREIFRLFKGQQVWDVQITPDHAYVRTPSSVGVVDLNSKRIVNEIVPPRDLVDVIVEPS